MNTRENEATPEQTSAMAPVPKDHPLMRTWEAYRQTPEYATTRRLATDAQHVDGSLWAAFAQGWHASGGHEILCAWCGKATDKTGPREKVIEEMSRHMMECEKSPLYAYAATLGAIDELRAEEGSSVEICCANPEGSGPDNQKVVVTACWTNWQPRDFRGQTVLLALVEAVKAKAQYVPE